MSRSMMCPCKGCQDRTITCHGGCKRYQEWKSEHEKKQEWLRSQRPETPEPKKRFFAARERKKARDQVGRRFGRGGGE